LGLVLAAGSAGACCAATVPARACNLAAKGVCVCVGHGAAGGCVAGTARRARCRAIDRGAWCAARLQSVRPHGMQHVSTAGTPLRHIKATGAAR
jgi:hypothetical protein